MIVIEFIVFLCSYTFYVILSASLYMSHVITEGKKGALECKVATSVFESKNYSSLLKKATELFL